MVRRIRVAYSRCFPWMLALAVGVSLPALAQQPPDSGSGPPPAAAAPGAPLPQDQLDSLLAPIALYPDQLLTQVLMASTYPLEVVEAARFLQQNPSLRDAALDQALLDKNWDPSVQSLAAFPQILAMMNDKLDWTQQLGDAFLANEAQVMDTVQSLRARAQAAGNLQSNAQQTVEMQDRYIAIEPAQPQVVYVPVYDPTIVYGPWWAPAYRPWFWYPPPIYGYAPLPVAGAIFAGIVWGSAWAITGNNWGWCRPAWGGHSVNINVTNTNNIFINHRPQYRERYANGQWQHLPEHRRGVAYRDPATRNRYQRPNPAAVNSRETYRGYDNARPPTRPGSDRPAGANPPRASALPATPSPRPGAGASRPVNEQPMPTTQVAPVLNPRESRPQVQMESGRGQASRQTMSKPVPRAGVPGGKPGNRPQPQPGNRAPVQSAGHGGGSAPGGGRGGGPQRGGR